MESCDPDAQIHTDSSMEDPSPYFQVEREPIECGDDFFDQPFPTNHTPINTLSTDEVVAVLWLDDYSRWYFQTLRTMSMEADDYSFYESAITAAATLVFQLFRKDYLYEVDRSLGLKSQLNKLWQEFTVLGNKDCSLDEVCKLVVGDELKKKTYSLVTECEVADMLIEYDMTLSCPKLFDDPYIKDFTREEDKETIKTKNVVLDDFERVVGSMEPPERFKADDFTRLLIKLAKLDAKKYSQMLLTRIAVLLDTDGLSRLSCVEDQFSSKEVHENLKILIIKLFQDAEQRIIRLLVKAHKPLHALTISDDIRVCCSVYDIIEAAGLHRCALGDRFINRHHLIWAFYECGYGLPRQIRNMSKFNIVGLPRQIRNMSKFNIVDEDGIPLKIRKITKLNIVDEDHPPYHIYMMSLMLVKLLEVKDMRVEHFMFAVLYSKGIVDESQMTDLLEDFAEFLKEVDSDSKMRPKVNCAPSEKLPFESYGLDYDISLVKLNQVLKSGKLEDLVRECSSMMVA